MGRFWSIVFLLVPVLGVWVFLSAATDLWPFSGGWLAFPSRQWLPEDVSEHGRIIDSLFNFIMYLTGVIFLGTGLALFWFLWRYDAEQNSDPVKYSHGNHVLEVVWSTLPAVILLFIAIYQMNAWADAKVWRPTDPGPDGRVGTADGPMLPGPDGLIHTEDDVPKPKPPLLEVTGRQFEWRLRYAGEDGQLGTEDDVHLVNDLHVPIDEDVVIAIKSDDVLHSFFLPNLRVKQDVVPGMLQYVWFKANKTGTYDIVCAELCGWGHYKMKGMLTIQSRKEFDVWLRQKYQEQETSEYVVHR